MKRSVLQSMLRPDYVVVNDCVRGVSVFGGGEKREKEEHTGQADYNSRKAERGAENQG